MTREVHRFWDMDHEVLNGVFTWEGLRFYVREGAQGLSDVGIVRNCLDRDGFSYWHLGEPYVGIVVDIGAHIGGFTCAVAKQAKHVFAYEASSDNFKLLIENVAANNLTNVTCFHKAVGDGHPRRIELVQSTSTSPSCLWLEGRDTEETPGVSLEEIVEDAGSEIELIKVDCEGGEYDLFLGKPRASIRTIKMIASEVHTHPNHSHEEFIEFIASNGYRVHKHASRSDTCCMADFYRIKE